MANFKDWIPPVNRGLAPLIPPLYRPPVKTGGIALALNSAISGFENASNKWGSKPIVVGDVIGMRPPLNAVSYTEVENVFNPDVINPATGLMGRYENRLYLHAAFNFGPGPLLIFNPRIGDKQFNTTNFPYSAVQYNYGRLDDAPQTLYPYDVAETQLSAEDGALTHSKEVIKLVPQECDRIRFIIAFPDGLKAAVAGVEEALGVLFNISATDAITGATTTLGDGTFLYTAHSTPSFYAMAEYSVPRGRYNFHITRLNVDHDPNPPPDTSNYKLDTTYLFAVQGIKNSPPWTLQRDTHGVPIAECIVAVKIAAFLQFPKNELNDAGTPAFIFDVAGLMPYSNGSGTIGGGRNVVENGISLGSNTYGLINTDTPARIAFALLVSGGMNGMAVDTNRLDIPSFVAWDLWCRTSNTFVFAYDNVIDQQRPFHEIMDELCQAGRASWHDIDGKIGIVIEKLREGDPVQHFTPRNMFNFKFRKEWQKDGLPHGMKCQFLDYSIPSPEGPATNEVLVFADGYDINSATKYIVQEFPGVHNTLQLAAIAKYQLDVLKYRPTTYSFETETDGLICHRGDLVMVATDLLWPQQFGRITSVVTSSGNLVSVTLDETMTIDPSLTYAMRVRTQNNTSVYAQLNLTDASSRVLTLETPTAYSATASQPCLGDLVQVGPIDVSPAKEMLITEISHSNNLTATISCVDYAPRVYYADGSIEPPENGTIGYEPRHDAPLTTPTYTGYVVDVDSLKVTFSMNRPPQHDHVQDWQWEISSDGGTTWSGPVNTNTYFNRIVVRVPAEGVYSIRIRSLRDGQYFSAWATLSNVLIGSKRMKYRLTCGYVPTKPRRIFYTLHGTSTTAHTP